MSNIDRLGLGTVQWGMDYGIANQSGRPSSDHVAKMLRTAQERGVLLLDTAHAYGEAEILLGRLQAAGMGFQIVTKINAKNGAEVPALFEESLTRLHCERVYGLLLQRAEGLLEPEGASLWAALETLKAERKVRKIGVSVYRPRTLEEILKHYPIDLVQLPFNIYDQRFADDGLLERLKTQNVEIHARSAFLQGLLLMRPSELPARFASLQEHHARLHAQWDDRDLSPLEGSLGFCWGRKEIDKVIVGCESPGQLLEILEAATKNPADFQKLASYRLNDGRVIDPSQWNKP